MPKKAPKKSPKKSAKKATILAPKKASKKASKKAAAEPESTATRQDVIDHFEGLARLPEDYCVGAVVSISYPGIKKPVPVVTFVDSKCEDTTPMGLIVRVLKKGQYDHTASVAKAKAIATAIHGIALGAMSPFLFDGNERNDAHLVSLYTREEIRIDLAEDGGVTKRGKNKAGEYHDEKPKKVPKKASKKAAKKAPKKASKKAAARKPTGKTGKLTGAAPKRRSRG